MIGLHDPEYLSPFGGLLRAPWPWTINRQSPQAVGLQWWWPVSPFKGADLRDLGRRGSLATGTGISLADHSHDALMGHIVEVAPSGEYWTTTATDTTIPDRGDWGFGGWARVDVANGTSTVPWGLPAFISDSGSLTNIGFGNLDSGGDGVYFYNWDGSEKSFGPGTITIDAWHHLFWRQSGSVLRGYVNGVQVGSIASGSTDSGYTMQLCKSGSNDANVMTGAVADFRVYCPAPSPSTIYQMWAPATRWNLIEAMPFMLHGEGVAASLLTRTLTGVGV